MINIFQDKTYLIIFAIVVIIVFFYGLSWFIKSSVSDELQSIRHRKNKKRRIQEKKQREQQIMRQQMENQMMQNETHHESDNRSGYDDPVANQPMGIDHTLDNVGSVNMQNEQYKKDGIMSRDINDGIMIGNRV